MGSTGSAAGTPAWCHAGATVPPLAGGRAAAGRRRRPGGCAGRGRRGRAAPAAAAAGASARGDAPVSRRCRPRPGRPPGRCGAPACRPSAASRSVRGGRVAVGVVGADRDQRHPGAAGGEEVRVGVTAAVVRHLEHVGAQVDAAPATSRASASAPRSPVNSMRTPRTVTRATTDRSLGRRPRASPGRGRARAPPPSPRPTVAPVARHEHRRCSRPALRTSACEAAGAVVGRGERAGRDHARRPGRSSAPASPPTWSASRWDSSTSGSASTPSRSRQRSTGADVGSGIDQHAPAPGPAGHHERIALPDVAGDQHRAAAAASPGPTCRSGQPTTSSADQRGHGRAARSRGNRHRHQPGHAEQDGRQQDARRPPPAGHAAAPSGTAAARSATATSQRTGQPASHTSASAERTAARAPTSGGQQPEHGRRRDRRGGEQVRRQRDEADRARRSPAISGAVARPGRGADGHRVGQDRPGNRRRRSAADHAGASSTMAAVAATDRANPASAASRGSTSSSTHTAAARAGTAARDRPDASASSATAPMAAARSTLALGRASTHEAQQSDRRRPRPAPAGRPPGAAAATAPRSARSRRWRRTPR